MSQLSPTGTPPQYPLTAPSTTLGTAYSNSTTYAQGYSTSAYVTTDSTHDKIQKIRLLQDVLRDPALTSRMKSIAAAKLVIFLKEL
jgi:hypothetical protein